MMTLSLRSKVAADGCLHLHIPCDLPPCDADVVVVVQPLATKAVGPPFRSDEGVWAGKLRDDAVETDLLEMNQIWKKSMELPE